MNCNFEPQWFSVQPEPWAAQRARWTPVVANTGHVKNVVQDLHLWNQHDQHNKDIDQLVDVLQLWNQHRHRDVSLCDTAGMSTTLPMDCNSGPRLAPW